MIRDRRAFLRGTAQAVGSALALGACGRTARIDRADSTTSSAATPGSGTTATPAPIASTSTTTALDAPTTVAPTAWAGADFGALDGFLARSNTEAFAIVEGGDTIHEWHRGEASYRRDIASAQKSVLSLLVGRAIGDGLFDTETPVDSILGPKWTSHGQTSGITVNHLLTMTSGLDDQLALSAPPATEWRYSGAFSVLFDVLKEVTGREVDDLAGEWLFDAVGARGATFYLRRSSGFAPIGLFAGVADLIAIGGSVLDATQPGLAAGWIDRSMRASQTFNPAYGLLWWLNGQSSYALPGPAGRLHDGALIPSAPPSVVAALGKDDQKLYVSRELNLLVARLGGKADPTAPLALTAFDAELWTLLVALRSGS